MTGTIGFQRCHLDHSMFIRCGMSRTVVLVIYVDDILLLTRTDISDIEETKEQQFVTKDMGKPKYFLGIEIAQGKCGVILPNEVCLSLLEETRLLGCKPANTPIDTDPDFWSEDGESFEHTAQYK